MKINWKAYFILSSLSVGTIIGLIAWGGELYLLDGVARGEGMDHFGPRCVFFVMAHTKSLICISIFLSLCIAWIIERIASSKPAAGSPDPKTIEIRVSIDEKAVLDAYRSARSDPDLEAKFVGEVFREIETSDGNLVSMQFAKRIAAPE